MCDSQSEAFKDMLAALEELVDNGVFFDCAIELSDGWDCKPNGEEWETCARAAIAKAHKEMGK